MSSVSKEFFIVWGTEREKKHLNFLMCLMNELSSIYMKEEKKQVLLITKTSNVKKNRVKVFYYVFGDWWVRQQTFIVFEGKILVYGKNLFYKMKKKHSKFYNSTTFYCLKKKKKLKLQKLNFVFIYSSIFFLWGLWKFHSKPAQIYFKRKTLQNSSTHSSDRYYPFITHW